MKLNHYWIIYCFAVLGLTESSAQITIDEFLNSANDDVSLKIFDDQIGYLDGKPYRLSYLNKFEVRAQNNEFYSGNPRYSIRLTPSNPWEVVSNNRYYKAYQEALSYEKEIALRDALKERYDLVIEFLYFNSLKTIAEDDKTLIDAQLGMLEKQQYSDFFDIDDYVDIKLDQMRKQVELEDIVYEVSKQVNAIDLMYKATYLKELSWSMDNIISVRDIEIIADSLRTSDISSSTLAYHDKKISMAQREYTLERSNINLGFIQTQYTEGRPSTRSPWGISAGINIPIVNPNKGDMAKRKLEIIEAQNEKLGTEITLKVERSNTYDRLKGLIARYYEIEKKINSLNVNSLGKTLSALNANNPIVIIKLNASLLKLQIILQKLRQDVLKKYVDLLAVYDQLQQRPLINYLSVGLKKIDEN